MARPAGSFGGAHRTHLPSTDLPHFFRHHSRTRIVSRPRPLSTGPETPATEASRRSSHLGCLTALAAVAVLGILADCHKDEKVADTQPARDCVQAQWDQQRETFAILYAQEGKFAEAIECVRLMAGFGSDGQLDAFKIITAKMKEAGKSNAEILEVFRTNMREAATLDWPGEKDRAVRRLLEEAKSLGIDQEPAAYREMLEEAFKVARTMAEGQGRPELKWSLMATLALSLHAAGASPERVVQAFAEAVASTGLLEIGSIRNDSIRAIIWDMISAGLILEATQIISTLEDQGAQAMVLWDLTLQIGNKAKNLGEIDLAFQKCLEIARTLSDLPRRIYTLELIASEMNRSSRNKTAVGEIFREAWETARLIEEAYQKADILTKLATEMANASVSRGEVQKVLGEALRAALRAGSETSLIEVAVQMKYAGMERSDVARVFSQALQLATAEAEYNTDKVASEMIKLGLYNEAIEIAQGIPPQRLGNYFADCVEAIRELGLQKVMSDYEVIIPALRKIMNRRVYDINGWNNYWREDYTRPVFEAAELIGKIALEARRTNHPEVLRRIIEDALPHIMGLLTFENPRPGIDYGYVYVLYPLRSTVLQALIDIGEASAITAIERCGNIAWYSPYQNDSYYSVADEKRTAVDYLRRQAQSVEFIPVPGTDMRYWDDHSIFIPQ